MVVTFDHRINLSDVSFLLPVRIDSVERYKNLLLLLRYLDKHTDTCIFILEADASPKISSHLLKNGVHYTFIEDSRKKFHRTHYINQLTWQVRTPYICICDADVIIPVTQLEETVDLLRNGYSYVLPYDGSLVMTEETEKMTFLETLDADAFAVKVVWEYVCGGAIFLNREDFIRAGMSNENITSWGPDDVEQRKRMEIFGFSMARVKGPLFHLWHPRGLNSSFENQEERIRLTEEYLKIASSGKMELQQYVDTWTWCREEKRGIEFLGGLSDQMSEIIVEYSENDCGLIKGWVGAAWVYLVLSEYDGEEKYREAAMGLLEQTQKRFQAKLPEGKIGIAWAIGLMRSVYAIPESFGETGRLVQQWLFRYLKAPGQVKLGGEDGILLIGWYYYSLLTGICPGYYQVVYYKEYLVFVTDQIYHCILDQTEISVKYLGQTLLLGNRLKFLGVNSLKIEKICVEARNKIQKYLSTQELLPEESGWGLFALWVEAEERKDVGQYPELRKWCTNYLKQGVFDPSDPRIEWIKNKLREMTGAKRETVIKPKVDCFSRLVALDVPLTWLYGWLFI